MVEFLVQSQGLVVWVTQNQGTLVWSMYVFCQDCYYFHNEVGGNIASLVWEYVSIMSLLVPSLPLITLDFLVSLPTIMSSNCWCLTSRSLGAHIVYAWTVLATDIPRLVLLLTISLNLLVHHLPIKTPDWFVAHLSIINPARLYQTC